MRNLPLLARVFIVQLAFWSMWVALQWNYVKHETNFTVERLRLMRNHSKSSIVSLTEPTASEVTKKKHAVAANVSAAINIQNTSRSMILERQDTWLSSPPPPLRVQYHRWKDPNGISVAVLLRRMKELLDANHPTDKSQKERLVGPIPAFIILETHQQQQQPTLILKLSWRIYYRRLKSVIHRRLQIVGPFVQDALDQLMTMVATQHSKTNDGDGENGVVSSSYNNSTFIHDTFPALHRLLFNNQHSERIIIPMLCRMDDFQGCDYLNYDSDDNTSSSSRQNVSLPHFTLSASLTCPNAFSIPSYSTIELAKLTATSNGDLPRHGSSWLHHFQMSDQLYPWSKKLPLAVWRGSLTGPSNQRKRRMQPRYRLAVLGKQIPHLLDVAVSYAETKVGGAKEKELRDEVRSYHLQNQHKLPYRLAEFYMNFSDFQRFRAVLDVDGNSWSERFPKLLCSSSVVIKIDPGQVDYFWPALVPHFHFLPASLQNLTEVVAFAVADEHALHMQEIVRHARQWCRTFMTRKHLQMDVLSILNGYVEELDRNNPDWLRYLTTKNFLELEEELAPFVPPTWQQRNQT